MSKVYNIYRVAEARQPYRRNGYSGPELTDFYWVVVNQAGKSLDIECTLKKAKLAVTEMGGTLGKIIRE